MAPDSVGHHYRVLNHAEAFIALGFNVCIAVPDQVLSILSKCHRICAVIVFRAHLNSLFLDLRRWVDRHQCLLLIDFDDLTFDLECLKSGHWSFWSALPPVEKDLWRERVNAHDGALQLSDGAFVSTEPLALSVLSKQKPAWVWPNGFGLQSWSWFQEARRNGPLHRRHLRDDVITIGYASGTPTHSADFEMVSVALGALMRRDPRLRLSLIGWMQSASYPALRGLEGQIDHRSLVPYKQLAQEYARFDINLAPLEEHSRFCQGKSALKFFEAAAVGVPTVATPTQPFRDLVSHRWNGCLASSVDDWIKQIVWLAEKRRRRLRLAYAASFTIWRCCSPSAQRRDLRRILSHSAIS